MIDLFRHRSTPFIFSFHQNRCKIYEHYRTLLFELLQEKSNGLDYGSQCGIHIPIVNWSQNVVFIQPRTSPPNRSRNKGVPHRSWTRHLSAQTCGPRVERRSAESWSTVFSRMFCRARKSWDCCWCFQKLHESQLLIRVMKTIQLSTTSRSITLHSFSCEDGASKRSFSFMIHFLLWLFYLSLALSTWRLFSSGLQAVFFLWLLSATASIHFRACPRAPARLPRACVFASQHAASDRYSVGQGSRMVKSFWLTERRSMLRYEWRHGKTCSSPLHFIWYQLALFVCPLDPMSNSMP